MAGKLKEGCEECDESNESSIGVCESSSEHTLTIKIFEESSETTSVTVDPEILSSSDNLDDFNNLPRSSSRSTIVFELDPNAKKRLKAKKALTPEEEEQEKINKFKLFQIDCDTKEALKRIKKLSEKNLLLVSKKKRRDADLQRYEMKLGDKTLKKNCVRHNWELFELQEKHRALRGTHIVELSKLRDIEHETNDLLKKVEHLSILAAKSDDESLDTLEHLLVRQEIQNQLYDQEYERFDEEIVVLKRDMQLLENDHHKILNEEKEKLKQLTLEHTELKKLYLKLMDTKNI